MAATSAGLLIYRRGGTSVQVLLGHPGGPFWAKRDAGAWSIPKGEHGAEEDPLSAARREFEEELGVAPPDTPVLDLGTSRLKSGKQVRVFATEGDLDPATVSPGVFEMEWPPRSGRTASFPEMDRVEWFTVADARVRLHPAQVIFVDRLTGALASGVAPNPVDPSA